MRYTILQDGKEISKKAAEKLIGKEELENRISDATQTHFEDPYTEISWMDGMEIEF